MQGKKPNESAQAEETLRVTVAAYRAKKDTNDFTETLRKLQSEKPDRFPTDSPG